MWTNNVFFGNCFSPEEIRKWVNRSVDIIPARIMYDDGSVYIGNLVVSLSDEEVDKIETKGIQEGFEVEDGYVDIVGTNISVSSLVIKEAWYDR